MLAAQNTLSCGRSTAHPSGHQPFINRRKALRLALLGLSAWPLSRLDARQSTLAAAPIELGGTWSGSLPGDVGAVIERMRMACLNQVPLVSDRQPTALRIENRPTGNPAIWLHAEGATLAWIVVNVGPRDWCKLAYQFGHELGHVLANSWQSDARPAAPCQWLEECVAEAFSIRGLRLLAEGWARTPPFANDHAFARAILDYRADLLTRYGQVATTQGIRQDSRSWLAAHRAELEQTGRATSAPGALVSPLLATLEADEASVADIGALNRWPGRTALVLPAYLDAWSTSCRELGATGRLPKALRGMLLG
jgi:hypothetical protein